MPDAPLRSVKRVGTGLAFVVFPLVFILVFSIHPNLLSFDVVTDVRARVDEFHNNKLMHFGHFLMLLVVPLLFVASVKLMHLLDARRPWLGYIGCVLAVLGAVVLAVDKTALCLVPSAFDTLPEAQFDQMLPGLEAMFAFKGWLAILLLLPLLPIGFLIQAVGLYLDRTIPRWQSVALMVAMVLIGVAAAVDIDLFGLIASVILAIALIPLGVRIMKAKAT